MLQHTTSTATDSVTKSPLSSGQSCSLGVATETAVADSSCKGNDEKDFAHSNVKRKVAESTSTDGSKTGGSRYGWAYIYLNWSAYTGTIKATWKDILKMLPSLYMVSALCFHFFGYECARAASITMLAAKEVGLGTRGLSYTVVVGSPASAAVLYFYARSFKRNGPLFTQRVSNILCIIMLLFMVLMCNRLNSLAGRVTVVCFYAFREIYVSLLSTQQWSFIASHLDKSRTSYLVTFAGIVSVSSAVGGCLVEYLVSFGGVWCLLLTSLICLIISYCNVEIAHALSGDSFGVNGIIDRVINFLMLKLNIIDDTEYEADVARADVASADVARADVARADVAKASGSSKQNEGNALDSKGSGVAETAVAKQGSGVAETPVAKQGSGKSHSHTSQRRQSTSLSSQSSSNVWKDAYNLFSKYQTLRLLLAEAVIHQFCSNMLNLMFHDGLRLNLVDDSRRAVVVGRFFAVVNVMSCLIQCLVLPVLLSSQSLPYLMCSIPMLVTLISFSAYLFPCLLTTMFAFGTLKVLEYSIMTSANEMIYMPMTTEVRSIGKELIRFFGQRLGKSSASLVLSALSAHFMPSLATQSLWSSCITLGWGLVMYPLARHLAERERVIETTAEKRRESISITDAADGESTAVKHISESGLRNRRISGGGGRPSLTTGDNSSSSHVEEKSDTTNESDEVYSNKSSSNDDEGEGSRGGEDDEAIFDELVSNSTNSGCSTPNLETLHLNWNVANATMDGLPIMPLRRRRAYTEGASDLLKTPKDATNRKNKTVSRIVHSAPRQKSNSEKSLEALCLDRHALDRHADLTIKMPVLMLRIDSQLLSLDQLSSSSYVQPSLPSPTAGGATVNPYAEFAESLQRRNAKKTK